MKVLVWKSYGDITVYAADTAEQVRFVVEQMLSCVEGWGSYMDNITNIVRKNLTKYAGDRTKIVGCFEQLRDAIGDGADQFEYLDITNMIDGTLQ